MIIACPQNQNRSKWYVVVLVCVVLYSCAKPKPVIVQDIPKPPYWYATTYTPKLNKSFTWKGYSYIGPNGNYTKTFFPDTLMAIDATSDTTLEFMGRKFMFVDSVYKTFAEVYVTDTGYVLTYVEKGFHEPHSGCSIKYYYKGDSITYSQWSGGLGGSAGVFYFTP